MRYVFVLLLLYVRSFAQPNVHIRGHFEGFPSSEYKILVTSPHSLVSQSLTSAESILQEKTDLNGSFQTGIRLNFPQKVTIVCLGYRIDFLLSPNDTLNFSTPSRSALPQVQGATANLHHFLYESLLFGKDSLCEKPLFQNMSLDNYSLIINDLSAHYWENYQRECDTSNTYVNTYVKASLEGQKFLRKRAYLHSQGDRLKNEPISFAFLEDKAHISDVYMDALYEYLLGVSANPFSMIGKPMNSDSTFWRKGYLHTYETLRKLPLTREIMLAQIVKKTLFPFIMFSEKEGIKITTALTLLKQFQEDFPKSPYLQPLNEMVDENKIIEKRMKENEK